MTKPLEVRVRVPSDQAHAFALHWKDLRIAEGLSAQYDLGKPVQAENFDGTALVEWVVPVVAASAPVITAVLGYLIASRGELEIERDGKKIKLKNIKPSKLKELLEIIDTWSKTGDS